MTSLLAAVCYECNANWKYGEYTDSCKLCHGGSLFMCDAQGNCLQRVGSTKKWEPLASNNQLDQARLKKSSDDFSAAIERGDEQAVLRMIDADATLLEARDPVWLETCFHRAAFFGHRSLLQALLQRQPDGLLTVGWKTGAFPIHSAVAGKTDRDISVVEFILRYSATLTSTSTNRKSAFVNSRLFEGLTPLYSAALRNKHELCDMLLRHGAQALTFKKRTLASRRAVLGGEVLRVLFPSYAQALQQAQASRDEPHSRARVLQVLNHGKLADTRAGPALPPKQAGAIRFVCMSDTHTRHASLGEIPFGDVLVHTGDFSNTGELSGVQAFNAFLAAQPHKHKIVIAGNHDTTFDAAYYARTGCRRFHGGRSADPNACRNALSACVYLEDSEVTVEGIRVYGSPWQPEFCDWAFNLQRGEEIRAMWNLIPVGVDVLLTHGPLHGRIGGVCRDGFDAGCEELTAQVRSRIKPAVHVSGHIHESYGVYKLDNTVVINASNLDLHYRCVNSCIVFDIVPASVVAQ